MRKQLQEDITVFNADTDEELDLQKILDELEDDGEAEDNPFSRMSDAEDEFAVDDAYGNELGPDGEEFEADALDYESGEFDGDGLDGVDPDDEGFDSEDDQQIFGDEEEGEDGLGLGDEADIDGDPDYQGMIRTVKGANLVFKRKTPEGDFEELWIYNIGKDIKQETQIRRGILAGTDIDPGRQQSEDGTQDAQTTSAGNVQFLHITGLPN